MQSFRSLTITTLTATAIGLGLTGGAAAGPEADGMLRIGGSTTLLPIIAKTASDFMERYKTWNRVYPALIKKDVERPLVLRIESHFDQIPQMVIVALSERPHIQIQPGGKILI